MGVEAEAVVVVAPTPNHEHGAQNIPTCLVCLTLQLIGRFFFSISLHLGLVWFGLIWFCAVTKIRRFNHVMLTSERE